MFIITTSWSTQFHKNKQSKVRLSELLWVQTNDLKELRQLCPEMPSIVPQIRHPPIYVCANWKGIFAFPPLQSDLTPLWGIHSFAWCSWEWWHCNPCWETNYFTIFICRQSTSYARVSHVICKSKWLYMFVATSVQRCSSAAHVF